MVAVGVSEYNRRRRKRIELTEPIVATIDEYAPPSGREAQNAVSHVPFTAELDLAARSQEVEV
jgi:hypothetical protein